MTITNQPAIVEQALIATVLNLGQLTAQEKRQLDAAVRAGILSKGKGGSFPNLKTMYAPAGFDFAAARQAAIDEMMYWHSVDVSRGVVSR